MRVIFVSDFQFGQLWAFVPYSLYMLFQKKKMELMYDLFVFVISIINIDNLCCIWYWVRRLNSGPGQNFLLNSVFVREALGTCQLSGQEIDQAAIIRTHSTQRVYTHIILYIAQDLCTQLGWVSRIRICSSFTWHVRTELGVWSTPYRYNYKTCYKSTKSCMTIAFLYTW